MLRDAFNKSMAFCVRKGVATSVWTWSPARVCSWLVSALTCSSNRSWHASTRKARGGHRWWVSSEAVGSRISGWRRPCHNPAGVSHESALSRALLMPSPLELQTNLMTFVSLSQFHIYELTVGYHPFSFV